MSLVIFIALFSQYLLQNYGQLSPKMATNGNSEQLTLCPRISPSYLGMMNSNLHNSTSFKLSTIAISVLSGKIQGAAAERWYQLLSVCIVNLSRRSSSSRTSLTAPA